jgi:hypothetical protein
VAAEARSSQSDPGRSNAVHDVASGLTFRGSPSEQSCTTERDRWVVRICEVLYSIMVNRPLWEGTRHKLGRTPGAVNCLELCPDARVLAPRLEIREDATCLPHVNGDGSLCLHIQGEWQSGCIWLTTLSRRKKRKAGSEKAGSLFADYPGVVALQLTILGLWGGADLGSDHLARHYQLDAAILLTAFCGTI